MSTIKFDNLNTWETFKDFLKAYHPRLKENKSFPPLGIQKALHEAAPIFGYNNAHEMAHALESEAAQAPATGNGLSKNEILDALQFVNELNAAVENESISLADVAESLSLDMPEVYILLDMTETLYNQVLRGELIIESADKKTQDKIQAIAVNVTRQEADNSMLGPFHTIVVRGWESATEYVRNIVGVRVYHNNCTGEDLMKCDAVTVPDDEDVSEMSDLDIQDWICEHNDIHALIRLIDYIDDGLTTVTLREDWI